MAMSKQIGIDLGTTNTLFFMKGKGIVLREPSVVAKNSVTGKVVSVGSDAKKMLGKTPGTIAAFKPLKDGVIADFDVTTQMIHQFFRKINTGGFFDRPSVIICIPYGVTEVEKKAFEDAAYDAMSKSVDLVEEPMAAAIGAGLRISGPRGNMIVDIGGGTTEVAVISLDGIVAARSLRTAGDELDEAIVNYVRRQYGVAIGTSLGGYRGDRDPRTGSADGSSQCSATHVGRHEIRYGGTDREDPRLHQAHLRGNSSRAFGRYIRSRYYSCGRRCTSARSAQSHHRTDRSACKRGKASS